MTTASATQLPTDVDSDHFKAWTTYSGLLHTWTDQVGGRPCVTNVYGMENESPDHQGSAQLIIPAGGAVFGFLAAGNAIVRDHAGRWTLTAGQWFALPDGANLTLYDDVPTRLLAVQRVDFYGLRAMGGPIERAGRLRYIDRCTDTCLAPPPLLGDPCLNHLHFPEGIDQTMHTHPSIRAGIVASGEGWCATPAGNSRLSAGVIFSIPRDGHHNFLTEPGQEMDVIAYHPDSDWGPTHENHPMVNRTWVDGEKIDNSTGRHLGAEFIVGDRRPA